MGAWVMPPPVNSKCWWPADEIAFRSESVLPIGFAAGRHLPGRQPRVTHWLGSRLGRSGVGLRSAKRLHYCHQGFGLQRAERVAGGSTKVVWFRMGNCTTGQVEATCGDNERTFRRLSKIQSRECWSFSDKCGKLRDVCRWAKSVIRPQEPRLGCEDRPKTIGRHRRDVLPKA